MCAPFALDQTPEVWKAPGYCPKYPSRKVVELGLKPKEAGLCVNNMGIINIPRLITWECYHFSAPFSERP